MSDPVITVEKSSDTQVKVTTVSTNEQIVVLDHLIKQSEQLQNQIDQISSQKARVDSVIAQAQVAGVLTIAEMKNKKVPNA